MPTSNEPTNSVPVMDSTETAPPEIALRTIINKKDATPPKSLSTAVISEFMNSNDSDPGTGTGPSIADDDASIGTNINMETDSTNININTGMINPLSQERKVASPETGMDPAEAETEAETKHPYGNPGEEEKAPPMADDTPLHVDTGTKYEGLKKEEEDEKKKEMVPMTEKEIRLKGIHSKLSLLREQLQQISFEREVLLNGIIINTSLHSSTQPQTADITPAEKAKEIKIDKEEEEERLIQAKNRVTKHIRLLHNYNSIRDIGTGLMGLIADRKGERMRDVYETFGVDVQD